MMMMMAMNIRYDDRGSVVDATVWRGRWRRKCGWYDQYVIGE